MNHFLPRRLLAVVFTALLGVVALSAVTAGPASAATYGRVLLPDSNSTMTIVDDEDWPWSDEVETFNLAGVPQQFVSAVNPVATYSFTRCAGDEVKVKVSMRSELIWTDWVKLTTKAVLYEGDDCSTAVRKGETDSITTYIGPGGWPTQIPLNVRNEQDGSDHASVLLSLTNYATVR